MKLLYKISNNKLVVLGGGAAGSTVVSKIRGFTPLTLAVIVLISSGLYELFEMSWLDILGALRVNFCASW